MVATTGHVTIADLERDGPPEGRWELGGELPVIAPAGDRPGQTVGQIYGHIWSFLLTRRLGRVFGPDTGFVVPTDPERLRVPDVGFVRAERLDPDRDQQRYLQVTPDLVVEVISPRHTATDVLAKVKMWLEAGSSLVWVVDPVAETVTVSAGTRGRDSSR